MSGSDHRLVVLLRVRARHICGQGYCGCSASPEPPTNTDMKKRFFDMTDDEIEKKARLTPDEKTAVDNFLAAAKWRASARSL